MDGRLSRTPINITHFLNQFIQTCEKVTGNKAIIKEIEERMEKVRSPFRTADSFLAEEIIDPRDTRRLLCDFANLAAPLRTPGKTSFG